jgi:hypothetical protein
MRFRNVAVLITAAALGMAQQPPPPPVRVLTQHNNNQRTGANLSETILNVSNVSSGDFGLVWQYSVEGQIYAQPLYMQGAEIFIPELRFPGFIVTKNIVYVATMHNKVYAFDAGEVGASPQPSTYPIWTYDANDSNSSSYQVHYRQVYDASPNNWNITPVIGIVSTPVIDPERKVMYVVAMTQNLNTKQIEHHLHEINIVTGAPNRRPVRIERIQSFPPHQLQRAALLLDKRDLYIAFASFADRQPYNGSIIHFDTTTLTQRESFIVSPKNGEGGIWQSGSGPAMEESGDYIYFVTGNGQNFNENNGADFDESDVKLNRRLTGTNGERVIDYYTPSYQNFLNESDLDLGVGGVTLLPPQPGPAAHQPKPGCPANGAPIKLLAHGSKAGLLYLINRDCLGHFDEHQNRTPPSVRACKDAHIHAAPVYWQSPAGPLVYTVCEQYTGQGIKAFTIRNGEWVKKPVTENQFVNGHQMSLSASGSTPGSGIIWMLVPERGQDSWTTGIVDGALRAFDAETLKELFTSDKRAADKLGKYAKFNAPTVANGHVYAPTFSECGAPPMPGPCLSEVNEAPSSLKVYGLPAKALTFETSALSPPLAIRAEGRIELVGDVVLIVNGGTPGTRAKVDIECILNTNITSRILGTGKSEALLLIDEPTNQILGVNAFTASQDSPSKISFRQVPINEPGDSARRFLRITNVRADANLLMPGQWVIMSISVTSEAPIKLNNPSRVVSVLSR